METTLNVALGEQEHLRDFFLQMKEQGRGEQAEDIEQLLAQLKGMKSEFEDALDEIRYLKEQISTIQDQTVKAKLRKMQEEVQTVMKQAQNRASSVKRTVELSLIHIYFLRLNVPRY